MYPHSSILCFYNMRQGLNSHYFHIIGDGHQPKSVGVQIPIIRIPTKGGMTIPNIATFDHGTHGFPNRVSKKWRSKDLGFQCAFARHQREGWHMIANNWPCVTSGQQRLLQTIKTRPCCWKFTRGSIDCCSVFLEGKSYFWRSPCIYTYSFSWLQVQEWRSSWIQSHLPNFRIIIPQMLHGTGIFTTPFPLEWIAIFHRNHVGK